MNKILLILSCFFLLGATPIRNNYEKKDDIKAEFLNAFISLQDRGFTIVTSTPSINNMKNGEIVIFKSGVTKLIIRINQTLYSVLLSTN